MLGNLKIFKFPVESFTCYQILLSKLKISYTCIKNSLISTFQGKNNFPWHIFHLPQVTEKGKPWPLIWYNIHLPVSSKTLKWREFTSLITKMLPKIIKIQLHVYMLEMYNEVRNDEQRRHWNIKLSFNVNQNIRTKHVQKCVSVGAFEKLDLIYYG